MQTAERPESGVARTKLPTWSPPWLVAARNELDLGVAEVPGPGSNPRIEQYHAAVGPAATDEVPWCASFVGWCLEVSGFRSSRSPAAISYAQATFGPKLPSIEWTPPGAILVWPHHVAFYWRRVTSGGKCWIEALGGNQSDRVTLAWFDPDDLVSIRWPGRRRAG